MFIIRNCGTVSSINIIEATCAMQANLLFSRSEIMCYRHAYKKVKVRERILGQFFYDLYSRRNKKGASSCKVTVNRLLINYS